MKIMIKYKMLTPVSHIGETASTGGYFQTILTSDGKIPVITGNSIRGQLRDSMAQDYLDCVNTKLSKDIFNIFFSGGNINGTMKDDVMKAKSVREHFPLISLLGGGIGDMLLSGKLICSFAYPICKESYQITNISSDVSWHNLIDEIEFTRMDDGKNDKKAVYLKNQNEEKTASATTQMRFSVQYLAAGTEFIQTIILMDGITDLEIGALLSGFQKWFEIPKLGGMIAKGFGLFDAKATFVDTEDRFEVINGRTEFSNKLMELIKNYHEFINREGTSYIDILSTGGKNGKKVNGATADNN